MVSSHGYFIVVEGIDGCGKTTQLQALYHWLTVGEGKAWARRVGGDRVRLTREPGATELGKSLRSLLLRSEWETTAPCPRAELLMYAADRAQHIQEVLLPHLQSGGWILCDRFTDSTIAYQGYGRGLDRGLIDQLNQIATGGLVSDLTLWIDLPVEIARSRLQARSIARFRENGQAQETGDRLDRMEGADLNFYQRVRQGFADLATQHPDRVVRIEGQGEPETIARSIQTILQARLQARRS